MSSRSMRGAATITSSPVVMSAMRITPEHHDSGDEFAVCSGLGQVSISSSLLAAGRHELDQPLEQRATIGCGSGGRGGRTFGCRFGHDGCRQWRGVQNTGSPLTARQGLSGRSEVARAAAGQPWGRWSPVDAQQGHSSVCPASQDPGAPTDVASPRPITMTAHGRIPPPSSPGFLGSGKDHAAQARAVRESTGEDRRHRERFGERTSTTTSWSPDPEQIIQMSNGCVCCTIRGDLRTTLHRPGGEAPQGRSSFERVVIETTGLADPGPVAEPSSWTTSSPSYLLDSILTVVDAKHAAQQLNDRAGGAGQVGLPTGS